MSTYKNTVLHLFNYYFLFIINTIDGSLRADQHQNKGDSVYSFSALDANGNLVSFADFKGMVLLIVNVASECGYTEGHYKGLVTLQQSLSRDYPFTVLAFPCNQFGEQEPGSNQDIQKFAKQVYGANFPIFAKIDTLGSAVPPFWSHITDEVGYAPSWNFWKYLVDQNGKVVNAWGPWKSVEEITPEIMRVIRGYDDAYKKYPDKEL